MACKAADIVEEIRMPQRLARWLSYHFVSPQTGRDVDLEHWWQMPDDPTRTRSPWNQLAVDLMARATFSEWHERVSEHRVIAYDRMRPTAVRCALLVIVAVLLLPLNAPWWVWVMLAPALVQIVLEVYLYEFIRGTSEPRWRVVRSMTATARKHFNTKTLNFTGAVGAVACPLIVLAVCLAPPGGEDGWVKIGALAAAIYYLNSGLTNVFLDPPNYTESSVMPPVMHGIRPFAPFISLVVVGGLVAIGAANDRWEPALLPLALVTSILTLALGSTIRDHDRVVAACAHVAREAVLDGRKALGRIVHDDLGPAKAAAESVSAVPGVPYDAVVDLRSLAAFLKHFHTRVGLHASQRMHLSYLVEKLISPYGISPRQVSFDIEWDEEAIRKEDHQVALRMVTALVHNLGQALERAENREITKSFSVHAFQTGTGRHIRYHIAVRDHLPMISDDEWRAADGSLAALREWLLTEFNGDLRQQDMGDGTKQVTASWDDMSPAE